MTSQNNLDDKELLKLLNEGSYEAFTTLYFRYAETLVRFTNDKLKDPDETKDIIHDIFLKIWTERSKLKIDGNFKAYIYTTARNKITDTYRKRLVRGFYDAELASIQEPASESLDTAFDAKELHHAIISRLDELPPRTKEIFKLSRFDNLSIPQIASRLNISEQTIKNQLSIALTYLRKKIVFLLGLIFLINN
ncbi:RNA polymerase sigma factor [Mucilaginibacter lacusdianchii]|uniref:RNA polymerase sigma factor n=1 Tax=Mucilaginibacter lacusdianchii TaxID=2684211 RepID=UPI00131E8F85|nr:RNA polymerase sigma-70 factor [Mucilaginibacter sp. JXJ CY 39]